MTSRWHIGARELRGAIAARKQLAERTDGAEGSGKVNGVGVVFKGRLREHQTNIEKSLIHCQTKEGSMIAAIHISQRKVRMISE